MAMSTTQNWLDISKDLYSKIQFLNCVEAVYGIQTRLECPPRSGPFYNNYKHFFSLIQMDVCGTNYCFTIIIDIGLFNKSDYNILKKSAFGKKIL